MIKNEINKEYKSTEKQYDDMVAKVESHKKGKH